MTEYLAAANFGSFRDVLKWEKEESLPVCGDGQVLIKVEYVELNPVDLQKLQPHNKSGQQIPNGPMVVGYGGSGIVVETATNSAFQPNQRVIFLADPRKRGAYATHVVVDEQCVCLIVKEDVSLHDAATIPLAGCTAYESLEKLEMENPAAKNYSSLGGPGVSVVGPL